jgi:hypothetical protein
VIFIAKARASRRLGRSHFEESDIQDISDESVPEWKPKPNPVPVKLVCDFDHKKGGRYNMVGDPEGWIDLYNIGTKHDNDMLKDAILHNASILCRVRHCVPLPSSNFVHKRTIEFPEEVKQLGINEAMHLYHFIHDCDNPAVLTNCEDRGIILRNDICVLTELIMSDMSEI